MNEESIANQYSPIDNDMVDSSDQFEMSTSLNEEAGEQRPDGGESKSESAGDEECPATATTDAGELKTEEPAQSKVSSRPPNEDKNEHKVDCLGLNDLQNDDISDDENFKDDELDFEEADNNSRNGCNEESLAKPAKQSRAEDGEVNSEEELEDGEVKEEDSDEELDNPLNDGGQHPAHSKSNLSMPSPANLNALCRFYSKGLCTWGNSCRFVHDKPMGMLRFFCRFLIVLFRSFIQSLIRHFFRSSFSLEQVCPPPTVRTRTAARCCSRVRSANQTRT